MTFASDTALHYRRIRTILVWILALNWAVALAKIIYGYLTRCASMTADGFHSLSDGTSNIICLIGIHFACQPVDRDHPYGHKKYETLFSLIIAALLFIVCFNLLKEGIERLRNPVTPSIDLASFVIMLATLGINFLVMTYEYKRGKLLHSDILISDSLHTKADIFTSLSVIAGLAVMKINPALVILDPIVTMMISLFIAHAAFEIIRESSRVLCDTAVIMDEKKISDIVLSIRGVQACHKIRTRGREDDIHIDLHVLVKPDMHMDEAHRISDAIEEALTRGIAGVSDVVVHMEPRD
ncbi:MAG: cation diffusion facilitator family transporter [Candidatus Omnitrophica bacterium]|nr:cation diffusion facilitator family transporter [Candidatus Omnitrophota bacterium]